MENLFFFSEYNFREIAHMEGMGVIYNYSLIYSIVLGGITTSV